MWSSQQPFPIFILQRQQNWFCDMPHSMTSDGMLLSAFSLVLSYDDCARSIDTVGKHRDDQVDLIFAKIGLFGLSPVTNSILCVVAISRDVVERYLKHTTSRGIRIRYHGIRFWYHWRRVQAIVVGYAVIPTPNHEDESLSESSSSKKAAQQKIGMGRRQKVSTFLRLIKQNRTGIPVWINSTRT